MELSRGSWIGPYRVDALIARGGMGAVYRAARTDGAPVALKVLHASAQRPEQLARFEREAQLAARLSHPGIVRIHGAGAVQGAHYIAMDLVEGEPLAARCGRLAPLQAARLVAQVARAIEHAHAHGVLHRDIKASNVLVRRDGDEALITDFGIARSLEGSSLTKTGALVGTPTHMAPEQVTGLPVTAATDVHGLGVLLYEALTGTPPFQRDELAALMVAVTSVVPAPPSALRPEVPPALDRLVLAALQKVPARRPSAAAFAAGLEDVVAGRRRRAPPGRAARVALGAAAIAAGVAVTLRARGERPAPEPAPERSSAAASFTALPAPAVAPEDAPWLRALLDGGDLEQLTLAVATLSGDALAGVSAPTRARAVEALARLDQAWSDPRAAQGAHAPDDMESVRAGFQRLLFIHTLWRRLDPDHRLPPARDAVLNEMIFLGAVRFREDGAVVCALVDLMPDAVHVHAMYAQASLEIEHDAQVLRRGLELADAAQDHAARQEIVLRLASRLDAETRKADAQRAEQAAAELDALLQDALERAKRGEQWADTTALKLSHRVAARAARERRFDDGLALLERALRFDAKPWWTHGQRINVHLAAFEATSSEPHRAGAVSELQAIEGFARRFDDAITAVADFVMTVVGLFDQDGRWQDARGVLDGALEVLDGNRGAESSLLRALLVARHFPDDVDGISAALDDLAQRLQARREVMERRSPLGEVAAGALDHLQVLAREGAGRLARGELDPSSLAAALEQHPARPYLPHAFKLRR